MPGTGSGVAGAVRACRTYLVTRRTRARIVRLLKLFDIELYDVGTDDGSLVFLEQFDVE
jgi:hypothetical protein